MNEKQLMSDLFSDTGIYGSQLAGTMGVLTELMSKVSEKKSSTTEEEKAENNPARNIGTQTMGVQEMLEQERRKNEQLCGYVEESQKREERWTALCEELLVVAKERAKATGHPELQERVEDFEERLSALMDESVL